MTISPTTRNSEPKENNHISRGELAYVTARNQHNAHNMLLRAINDSGKSQKELAQLTGIDEATISRILRRPSNFQINTYSKLLYAACQAFVSFSPVIPDGSGKRLVNAVLSQKEIGSAEKAFVYKVADESEMVLASESTPNSAEINMTLSGSVINMQVFDYPKSKNTESVRILEKKHG